MSISNMTLEEQLKAINDMAELSKAFLELVENKDTMHDFALTVHAEVYMNSMTDLLLQYTNKMNNTLTKSNTP